MILSPDLKRPPCIGSLGATRGLAHEGDFSNVAAPWLTTLFGKVRIEDVT